jgi:ribonucleoside-diphosphate reductase alpha chain
LSAPVQLPRPRRRLPDRREVESLDFEHGGQRYTAGIGRFPDGSVAEIFLSASKAGSDAADIARDAAVTASLAFQHGCPVAILRKALTRASDGKAAGSIGAVLDLLDEEGVQ